MSNETPEETSADQPVEETPEAVEETAEAAESETTEAEATESAAAEEPEAEEPEAAVEEPEAAGEEAEEPVADDATVEEAAESDDSTEDAGAAEEQAPASESDEGEETAEAEEEAVEAGSELTLGSGEGVIESSEIMQPQTIRGKVDKFGTAIGTGRRKTSVARVRVKDGTGELTINGRALGEYFQIERDRNLIMAPLKATDSASSVDVWVRVNGGGTTGQAGAIVLGIARALQARNADLHHTLSSGGYLSRDGRMVERKKYGFKKARKSFQFSKR